MGKKLLKTLLWKFLDDKLPLKDCQAATHSEKVAKMQKIGSLCICFSWKKVCNAYLNFQASSENECLKYSDPFLRELPNGYCQEEGLQALTTWYFQL